MGSSSAGGRGSMQWDRIWKSALPGKVCIFLWRLAHNSLPLCMNAQRKRIELDTRCPVCMRLDEDGGHLFLKWKFVQRIWSDMDMEDPRLALLQCKNAAVVFEHLWTLVAHKRDASFVLLWEGWSARNKVNAGGKLRSADVIVYSIRQHIQEFKAGMKVANASVASQQILQQQRPPDSTHKVNFDASFYAETGRGAWGCVVRNSQGEFLAAPSGYLEHMAGTLHAEMSACVRAVEAAAELGIHRVIFESNSSVLVKECSQL